MYGSPPLVSCLHNEDQNAVADLILSDPRLDLEAQGPRWDGTALYYAAARGLYPITEILLAHGASVHSRTKTRATPLHAAADCGRTDIVRLLLKYGACPDDVTEFGDTCGHLAAYRGHVTVLRVLLQCGLRTDIRNVNGYTMLEVAEQRHHHEAVELLEKYRSTYYAC